MLDAFGHLVNGFGGLLVLTALPLLLLFFFLRAAWLWATVDLGRAGDQEDHSDSLVGYPVARTPLEVGFPGTGYPVREGFEHAQR